MVILVHVKQFQIVIYLKPKVIYTVIIQHYTFSGYCRLISVVDVVITPMNPYQPIPFHILSFAVFQSIILIYASSTSDEIAEEEKVFERKDRFS